MSQPTPSDVFVSRPLSNVSLAYWQQDQMFIADRMFQAVPSDDQAGIVWEFDREYFLRNEMKVRAPNTQSAGVGFKLNQLTYAMPVLAVHHDIPDQRRANERSPISSDRAAALLLSQQAKQYREIAMKAKAFTSGAWSTTAQTGVAAGPAANQFLRWDDNAAAPIRNMIAFKEIIKLATGLRPNVLAIGQPVWNALRTCPDIMDRIKYGQTPGSPAQVTLAAVAALFELDEILVSDVIQATNLEGNATFASSYVIGKEGLLFYRPPAPSLETPAAGYTMVWRGYMGMNDVGVRVKKFRMEPLASDRVELEQAFDPTVFGKFFGLYLATMVS
jgi:hypothetical protein